MKVAFICTEMLPSPAVRGGAIQMMIDGVTPYLNQEYQLTIFSITDPELPEQEYRNGVKYIHLPPEKYEERVVQQLQDEHFDIIHVFNRPKNIPLYKEAAPSSQFVLGLHNDMLCKEKVAYEEGKAIVQSVDRIVTVSEYIKQIIVERFPEVEGKIRVVRSGVNLKDYPPIWSPEGKEIRSQYRKKYNVENKKVILFVGRLTKNKGPHLLLSAFKAIANRHPDSVLVIAGGKWFSDDGINKYVWYLRKLAEPLQDRIIFTKFIPADEIPNIFLMSDIFVCTSQWQEPLARVHYEAFAAGVPVVTTNRGGNSEVVKHKETGYLIEDFQKPAEFAKAVHFYLTNPNTANKITRNARDLVESNFQFQHVSSRLTSVYSELQPKEAQQALRGMPIRRHFGVPLFTI